MLWVSLEAPRGGASNEYHNMFFFEKQERYQYFSDVKSALSVAMFLHENVLFHFRSLSTITKTCLFKCIENFTSKN